MGSEPQARSCQASRGVCNCMPNLYLFLLCPIEHSLVQILSLQHPLSCAADSPAEHVPFDRFE